MTLDSRFDKLGRLCGIGACGLVIAAYGCGGSSSTDQNDNPARGSGGHHAGAAGRSGAGTAGTGATSAGKSGSAGSTTSEGGRSASAGTGGKGGTGVTAGKGGSTSGAGKGGTSTSGGATANGGEGGATSGAGGQGGAPVCNPDDTSVPFVQRCLACTDTTCGQCLCTDCTQKLQTCQDTPGCEDIASCVINSGCNSIACYCGTHQLAECLTGQSDGPCKDAILNAPGGHEPSASDISAGPAADAALSVGLCAASGGVCAPQCM